jgi:glycosyltransferase involved in cell wall biosynthesis
MKKGEKKKLTVGIDATSWQNNRGYGRHARSLLTSLTRLDENNRYVFVLDSYEQTELIPETVERRMVQSMNPTTLAASANNRRSARDMINMSRALSDPTFDVLFFPTIYSFVPVFSRARKMVMIHDVIPEKYPRLTFPKLSSRWFWKLKGAIGRKQADVILTVSEYSRDCISEHFRISPHLIQVVGEASDPIFRLIHQPTISHQATPHLYPLNLPLDYPMLIYVGGFGPHKNLYALIDIFAKLVAHSEFSDTHLIMVGEYQKEVFYSEFSELNNKINTLGLNDKVVFTGFLPDEELAVLLNLGTLLILPSFMEGFGLPAIEAAACGCPVIATKESPLPSLLGNAGVYIDPHNPLELLTAFIDVLGSNRKRMEMRQAGLAASHRLTWDNAARQFIEILDGIQIP